MSILAAVPQLPQFLFSHADQGLLHFLPGAMALIGHRVLLQHMESQPLQSLVHDLLHSLSLTEQADSIIRDLQYARRKLEAEVLHDIPKEELLQLQETAEKILNRFQEKAKMQETLQKQKDGK